MTQTRLSAAWLRFLAGIVAVVGTLALTACGGGSGAPNNPYAPTPTPPGPLTVLPGAMTAYAGTPATLTVTGGAGPYQAYSSDASVLPISLAAGSNTIVLSPMPVGTAQSVTVTVQDSAGSLASSTVTVNPAPLINGMTITPNSASCGASAVCSGQTAAASVTVTSVTGAGIANRPIRFDVVQGDFAIQTTNPALPLVSTLTVTSDANGVAQVIVKANVNAFTQPALLRATDTTTGNQVTGQFTIVQTISGSAVLSVVPADATITSASSTACSAGFPVDYYIYGGTPPYRVTSTFPSGVTLVNSIVATSGGFFEAITNGTCVDPLTFSILDAVGLQTTATLHNVLGTGTPPTPPSLVIAPTTYGSSGTPVASCTAASGFDFVITGGTAPYGITAPGGTATPNPVNASGGATKITYAAAPPTGGRQVVVVDSSSPQKSVSATIFCP
jgi:hypothetical protein